MSRNLRMILSERNQKKTIKDMWSIPRLSRKGKAFFKRWWRDLA